MTWGFFFFLLPLLISQNLEAIFTRLLRQSTHKMATQVVVAMITAITPLTAELGGALGLHIIGCIMSHLYHAEREYPQDSDSFYGMRE